MIDRRNDDKKEIKKAKILASAIYSGAMLLMLVIFMLLSIFMKKPTVSVLEKRELAKWPTFTAESFWSGEYFKGITAFFADTFPFREGFISLASKYEDIKGIKYDDITIYHSTTSQPTEEEEEEETQQSEPSSSEASSEPYSQSAVSDPSSQESSSEASSQTSSDEGPGVVGEQVGSLFIYGNTAFEMYAGSESQATRYAGLLSNFASRVGEDVKVYNILIPTSIEINLPSKYSNVTRPQRPLMDTIFGNLNGVSKVDIYNRLIANKDKYLYFRTDHHWTALGAYCAYEEFASVAGYEANALSDYTEVNMGDYLGTLYNATKDSRLQNNPDTVYAYEPQGSYTMSLYDKNANHMHDINGVLYKNITNISYKYGVFIEGDNPYTKIVNNGTPKNDKKILVIKESYGNAFVPFIAPDYKEVHVADIRTFPYNFVTFVEQNDIDEVIFINNMFAACGKARIDEIDRHINS